MRTPRRPAALDGARPVPDTVWYAAFGSNMHLPRLRYYLAGGCPPGGARSYPGCRDTRDPERSEAILLNGSMYFATRSPVWKGGRAFYDPEGPGETPACAHLIAVSQFCDIAAQEMYEQPGRDLDLTDVLRSGRASFGDGRYETVVCVGLLDDHPVLTFTAPWRLTEVELTVPSAPYLVQLASGLMSAHGWSVEHAAEYLASRPGAAGRWTAEAVLELLRG